MVYRVEISARAVRDLRHLYPYVNAARSDLAADWFNGLEAAILSLQHHPAQTSCTPEDAKLRHLLYGRKRNIYRVIYSFDERKRVVTVPHIRHGARQRLAETE